MKMLKLSVLLLTLIFISCGDDEQPSGDTVLNYDGQNATAPTLPPGIFEFSARFPPLITRNVEGRTIESVSFYLYDIPTTVFLLISPDLSSTEPGAVAYTQELTNQLSPNSWNTIQLNQPYLLDGSGVWISIEVDNQSSAMQTVGCDEGPANVNGDWLFDGSDQQWQRFEDRVGESINWNIRAIISQ